MAYYVITSQPNTYIRRSIWIVGATVKEPPNVGQIFPRGKD